MPARIIRPILRFAMILGLSAGCGADCWAVSMYTVTDLGQGSGSLLAEAQALHPSLGLTLTDADKAALPSVEVLQGVSSPRLLSYPLNPSQNTDSGIVLGSVPSGGDRNNPLSMLEYGYTRKQADGTFGPYVHLTYMYHEDDPAWGHTSGVFGFASLDAKGNALVTDGHGQRLIDLNTGIATDLATLLPPGALDHVGNDSHPSVIQRAMIAADGTIFAFVQSTGFGYPDGSYEHALMLTPVATPEPSTLATFAVIAVGLAAARKRSKG